MEYINELQVQNEGTQSEIRKIGHVYIIQCDGGIKIGKTKNSVLKRIKNLQTANVNDIKIIMDYETCNEDLLEKIVHYILDKYRCKANREFFKCDVEYMKLVVEFVNNNLNTLKSTFESDSKNELYSKYTSNIKLIKERYDINDFVLKKEHDKNNTDDYLDYDTLISISNILSDKILNKLIINYIYIDNDINLLYIIKYLYNLLPGHKYALLNNYWYYISDNKLIKLGDNFYPDFNNECNILIDNLLKIFRNNIVRYNINIQYKITRILLKLNDQNSIKNICKLWGNDEFQLNWCFI